MVDFDTNALVLRNAGIKVVAGSVDSLEDAASIVNGMRIGYVRVLAELDGHAVAESTGALLATGDRTFLHATGFLIDPEGNVAESVYASGPIGRFSCSDILKSVAFKNRMREKASGS